ncbi:hypothetical protein A3K79_01110 [Candidatus Bathyarchaeota archaeon RBG_13_46_16b]|nr:MAG: hypothetical protein A3K79_01110 [Candidatus Bathyarchaeota archaeon RBG_13_46_16b]
MRVRAPTKTLNKRLFIQTNTFVISLRKVEKTRFQRKLPHCLVGADTKTMVSWLCVFMNVLTIDLHEPERSRSDQRQNA